jgi:hypothetical protein
LCDQVIPKDYALAHFPRKNQTVTLQQPGQSKKWHCKFQVRSDGGRCSLSGDFVRDNHLLEGDMCLFQPINEGKGRAFKVMVHLLRKASIDHPSSGNLSHHGLPRTKIASTVRIKKEQDEGMVGNKYYHPKIHIFLCGLCENLFRRTIILFGT